MTPEIRTGRRNPARILLLIPSAYFFYLNQGLALRQAFLDNGVDCLLLVDNMDDNSMVALLSGYRPEAVLAVNSFKRPVMERFPEILHVRWIQDNQFDVDYRKQSAHPLSDICYTATSRLKNAVVSSAKRFSGVLRFAADPVASDFATDPASPFSLIGYIPPADLLDVAFEIDGNRKFTGRDYFDFLASLQQNSLDTALEVVDQIVDVFLGTQGTTAQRAPEELLRLFREEYIRASNRCRLTRKILSLGLGCRIFGTPEWTTWPEFAPHFCGPLATLEDNRQVFRTTTLNLHNGGTLSHPRVFDCMASLGGPLLANRTLPEPELDFEPGVHYMEYDLSDFDQVARELLDNPARCREISRSAHNLIGQKHTWGHRAKQVLADMAA